MGIAEIVAQRSKEPSTQVGAVLVGSDHRILSIGYNGTPNGWDDNEFNWAREAEDVLDTKYPYVIHAERNAVLNYPGLRKDLQGATLYVTYFCCNECAKELVQIGITEVVYRNSYQTGSGLTAASEIIFQRSKVSVRQFA
jgi:dCMP deaminase